MHVKFSIRQTILIGQYVFMTSMLILILVFATKFKFNLFVQAYCPRLAQSVEHETLILRVVGSSPTLVAGTFLWLVSKHSLFV